ncbi:MAG: type II toxin-antitoxin system VapC family toxin [Mesorhizobium sp.]|nr:type II toxin-antitoxin system VapC family toxin [Mesorhizobium sp.]
MKALDTNVLLRLVLRDDENQFAKASSFLKSRTQNDPAYVSLIVLVEFVWTLRQRYRYERNEIRSVVASLLDVREIAFEDEDDLSAIVADADRGDLADHLIAYVARRGGCTSTVTFDKRAAKAVPSMEFLT